MNPAILYALLLLLHVLAAAFWVGGMATLHLAVRPAAAALLAPPQRLPLMAAVLRRFLIGVDIAIATLWLSGFAMLGQMGGFANAHWRVHAMAGLAAVMTLIYITIRARAFPALRRAVAEHQWPEAGAALNRIRLRVAFNLVLGVLVFVVALLGRAG